MQIVYGILYGLVGMLLAIPYCLLAGWSTENFLCVVLVAPAFLFAWILAASFAGIIGGDAHGVFLDWRAAFRRRRHRRGTGFLSLFWLWTVYMFLPIILHWSAALLGKIGYESVSSLIDTHRYASSLYVFLAILMLIVISGVVNSTCVAVKNVWVAAKSAWVRFAHR